MAAGAPGDHAGLPLGELVERARRDAPGNIGVAGTQLYDPATMRRTAHDTISHAESVHNVERRQRHVRRLEHVASGVEHKVRALAWFSGRCTFEALAHMLTKTCKVTLIQLHACENIHAVGNQPEVLNALLAPIAQFGGMLREGDTGHGQKKARVYGFVTCRDAVARERATFGPRF